MKTIKYIFLSYFQQYFFGTLSTLAGFFFLIVGLAYIINPNQSTEEAMLIFFLAIIVMSFTLSVHAKRLIRSNATALLPEYKKLQIITAGLVMSSFIIIPIIMAVIREIDILPWLAIFLFSSAIIFGVLIRYSDNIFIVLILFWTIRMSYEALGLPIEYNIIQFDPAYMLYLAITMIFGSILIYYSNIRRYNEYSVLDFDNGNGDDTDPWSKDYDKSGKFTTKYLNNLVKHERGETKGSNRIINRLMQITMFSPHQVFPTSAVTVVLVLIYLISLLFLLDPYIFYHVDWAVPILILVYHISAILITADFLQHRERIAMLWLYSPAGSRREFIQSLIQSYIIVVIRNFLVISMVFVVFGLTTSLLTIPEIFSLFIIGLNINLMLIAVSLLYFEVITSPEAKGWTVTNLILAFILLPIFLKFMTLLSAVFLGIMCIISGIFLAGGIHKLFKVDLDFESPAP
jgi:hypothetical protein